MPPSSKIPRCGWTTRRPRLPREMLACLRNFDCIGCAILRLCQRQQNSHASKGTTPQSSGRDPSPTASRTPSCSRCCPPRRSFWRSGPTGDVGTNRAALPKTSKGLLERNEPARPTARESVIPGTHNDSTVRSTTPWKQPDYRILAPRQRKKPGTLEAPGFRCRYCLWFSR